MITLKLGDFTFGRGEVPESIGFGASQELHIHTLVGGARVIDAMGAAPLRPEWSGWLSGQQALARARHLQKLAEAGQPLALSFGEFAYTVVIALFSADFCAGPNLPYSITLEIVRDAGATGARAARAGLVAVAVQDIADAVTNAAGVGDDSLIAVVGTVGAAVANGSGAGLTPAAIRPILPLIAAAQAQATKLDVMASRQITALGPLSVSGTVTGPDPLRQFVAGLAAATNAVKRSFLLNATLQDLGRLTSNLAAAGGAAGAGGANLTTGASDLYHVAAAAYGDARGWTRIAQANRQTDPTITGITQLVIPPADGLPATGVLNA